MANSKIAAVMECISNSLTGQYSDMSPIPVPDDATFPYITIQNVMDVEILSHDGPSGLSPCIIQVNSIDKDYEAADTLRGLVITCLQAIAGTFSGIVVQGAEYMYGAETFDAERELHMLHARFKVWFEVVHV